VAAPIDLARSSPGGASAGVTPRFDHPGRGRFPLPESPPPGPQHALRHDAEPPGLAAASGLHPAERPTRLVDPFGRQLTYLRVSVTDRCNLRCLYCLPGDLEFPDRDFLSADEIVALVSALVGLGVRRVRLTGGEPLVRKDLLTIVRRLRAIPGLENLALSTNGTELARLAVPLREAGIDRVNVSLDTLDPVTFREITRRGELGAVWAGVEAALAAGLDPVKLNAVLLARQDPADLDRLVALTLDRPLAMRFIEMMPTGANAHLQATEFRSADWMRERIEARYGPLRPVALPFRTGPAQAFRIPGAVGTVGFITPLSHTFCADCNRLRLTARGELRLCLFADRVYPLRALANDPEALEAAILEAVAAKPAEHMLRQGNWGNLDSLMQIGG
jgi:cyclic pyranopterin phosphate synthase